MFIYPCPSLTYLPIYNALCLALAWLVRVCPGQLRYSAVSTAVVYILSSQTVPVWRIPRVQLVHGAVWPLCRGGRGDLISFPEIFMKNRRLQIFRISTGAGYFSCHSLVISAGLLYEMWLMLKHYSIFWMGCRLVALQTCAHTVLNRTLSFFIVFSAEQHVGLLPVCERLLRG